MKKISLLIVAVLCFSAGIFAQNVDDALRYSQIFYGGTARFMSMGGAFTAIGGDISSLSQNPAGLGVFRSSEITLTPQLFHTETSARLFGNTNTDFLYNFNLNQVGIVSNLISSESDLISLNVAYSFNKSNNFNQTQRIQGIGENSSMADYWADNNEGVFYRDLTDDAGLAFDAWVIDTITGSDGYSYGTVFSNYGDNPPSVYGQTVRRMITNEGYTGEHAVSIGGNYNNKIYFGATLGIHKIRYTGHFEHQESTDLNLPSGFEHFTYTDHFENNGTGLSIKLGTIIRPVEALRIGLAFHSPTWYKVDEYFFLNMRSNLANEEFSTDPLRYEYRLSTPFRALAGAAIQIKKIGLVSVDYEFVDYSSARFNDAGDDYDYSPENADIRSILKSANNIRVGGELRLNKLYLRSGYSYYGKALKSGLENSDLDYSSVSFGIGFREQKVSVDFGYTNYKYDLDYILYNAAVANLKTVNNMFTLTLGYKFGYL